MDEFLLEITALLVNLFCGLDIHIYMSKNCSVALCFVLPGSTPEHAAKAASCLCSLLRLNVLVLRLTSVLLGINSFFLCALLSNESSCKVSIPCTAHLWGRRVPKIRYLGLKLFLCVHAGYGRNMHRIPSKSWLSFFKEVKM